MNYHMFSRRGNQKVSALITNAVEGWKAGRPKDAILIYLYQEYLQIEAEHPEISDTQVRDAIDQSLQAFGAPDWLIVAVREAHYSVLCKENENAV